MTKKITKKHTKTKTNTKTNPKTNTNTKTRKSSKTTNSKMLNNFQDLHNLIKEQLPLIEKLDLVKEMETLEKSEKYLEQKDKLPMLRNLVSGALKNVKKLNRKLTSSKIPEYIPLDKNDLNSCIKAEYNIKNKVEESGSGAFGDVIKTKGKKYTYAVKVINIDKDEDNPWDNPWDRGMDKLTEIETEAEITRKMGEIGIGPKLFDVYYCNNDGKPKYYFVLEYMNQGSLQSYLQKKNLKKLPPLDNKKLLNKLQKMHDNGYIHNDLHSGNVLINKNANGSLDFYISDFGLSNNIHTETKLSQDKELKKFKSYLESGDWWVDADENAKLNYLCKYTLANYNVQL
jgi:tRNA A-37 threonylcarbamoyl transferase component Bud32